MEMFLKDGIKHYIITKENVGHLNGKCFIDLERPDRLDILKFTVCDEIITMNARGTDGLKFFYNHEFNQEFGTFKEEDTGFGEIIEAIETDDYIFKEISPELYNECEQIISIRSEEIRQHRKQWITIKESIFEKLK